MEQCSQDHPEADIFSTGRSLLENLVDLVNDIRLGRRQTAQNAREVRQLDSESDDVSSGDSSGEDEFQQQQQIESVEDLQAELRRLEICEAASTLETLIVIVEHHVKSKDIEGFRNNVRRPDKWLLNQPRPKIPDVIAMAENLEKQDLPFRALMMYKATCALYKYEYVHHPDESSDVITPNMAVIGIEQAMGKVFDIFNAIFDTEHFQIYLPHFIPIMHDMLTNLREIRHADRKYKADLESHGMLYICIVFGRLQDVVQMHDVAETVVKTAERRFKSKARKRMAYGVGLLALSVAKFCFGENVTEVSRDAKSGLEALQDSKGLPSWDDKVHLIAKAEKLSQKINASIKI